MPNLAGEWRESHPENAIRESRIASRGTKYSFASADQSVRLASGSVAITPRGYRASDRIAKHMRNTGNHMDSINQQQPEQNHVDLTGAKAIEKMKQLVDKA